MAPLVRGRGGSRSGLRNPVSSRGRGHPAAKNGSISTFHSTRVEEQLDDVDDSEGSQVFMEDGFGSNFASDTSNDEDLEHQPSTAISYNTLLQSLKAKEQIAPPKRKKRKLGSEVPKDRKSIQDVRQSPPEQTDYVVTDAEDTQDQLEAEDAASIEDTEERDPFSKHYADLDEARLDSQIKNAKSAMQTTAKVALPSGTSCPMTAPGELEVSKKIFDAPPNSTLELQLKRKLQEPAAKLLPVWNDIHRDLGCLMFNYADLLYVDRTTRNADTLRKMSCVHLLNHVFKTRDRVIKNNARLMKDTNNVDLEHRDQGFTRPKVLVILPTRQSCVKWVETIVSLCEPEQQENRKRFQDSYTLTEDTLSEEKPDDFRELFGGNDDDMFRLGLKFTRKTIKYFSAFYNSDIIFASPLGLRMAIGAENDKKQDYDFLSSIEIMIADQADALSMQNWEHVEFVFEHLNLQPREAHGCDFSRVRNWYLDGDAKYFRQTMLFSAFNFPALNRLYLHQMANIAGKVKIAKHHEGAILQLGNSIKQTFSRFEYQNPVSEPDDRFTYFTTAIVPILIKYSSQREGGKQGVLVYLPLYADFVRVRNHLATSSTTQNISFGSISEYTSVREVARARSHFFTGRHSVLLYTERAHHFRRYYLRGVSRIFMYGLPENPIFYEEIVGGYLGASVNEGKLSTGEASVRGLFSKLDILKLERIVGSSRISSMLKDKGGDTFDFV